MNPVDSWAALFPRYCLTPKSLVKYLMCSYERAGWLSSQDLCFSIQDLGKQAGKFCLMHTSRLRVVPHFSSGIVEQAKRERA